MLEPSHGRAIGGGSTGVGKLVVQLGEVLAEAILGCASKRRKLSEATVRMREIVLVKLKEGSIENLEKE